jgi:hypothetical protein
VISDLYSPTIDKTEAGSIATAPQAIGASPLERLYTSHFNHLWVYYRLPNDEIFAAPRQNWQGSKILQNLSSRSIFPKNSTPFPHLIQLFSTPYPHLIHSLPRVFHRLDATIGLCRLKLFVESIWGQHQTPPGFCKVV